MFHDGLVKEMGTLIYTFTEDSLKEGRFGIYPGASFVTELFILLGLPVVEKLPNTCNSRRHLNSDFPWWDDLF